jgi:SAM-dependent methyltransferase
MEKSRKAKLRQFLSVTQPSPNSTILDAGAAEIEYSPFDNYLEKKYPYPSKVTALSIHVLQGFKKRYPNVQAVTYRGGGFPFKDKSFSVVFSNAVIEHVGCFDKQLQLINEMNRVGGQFYFTTPAKEFPLEIHTNYPLVHWLPKKAFDRIVKLSGKGWAAGNYMNLLTRKDLETLLGRSNAARFLIMPQKFGPFTIHYGVWGQ